MRPTGSWATGFRHGAGPTRPRLDVPAEFGTRPAQYCPAQGRPSVRRPPATQRSRGNSPCCERGTGVQCPSVRFRDRGCGQGLAEACTESAAGGTRAPAARSRDEGTTNGRPSATSTQTGATPTRTGRMWTAMPAVCASAMKTATWCRRPRQRGLGPRQRRQHRRLEGTQQALPVRPDAGPDLQRRTQPRQGHGSYALSSVRVRDGGKITMPMHVNSALANRDGTLEPDKPPADHGDGRHFRHRGHLYPSCS